MIAWFAGVALATVTVATEPVTEGVEVLVLVTDELGDPQGGETVRVVHRPGLAGEKELAIGITIARGTIDWTPESPGIARVRAGEEVVTVRVVPARVPTTTAVALALVLVAGSAALGWGIRGPRRGRS